MDVVPIDWSKVPPLGDVCFCCGKRYVAPPDYSDGGLCDTCNDDEGEDGWD